MASDIKKFPNVEIIDELLKTEKRVKKNTALLAIATGIAIEADCSALLLTGFRGKYPTVYAFNATIDEKYTPFGVGDLRIRRKRDHFTYTAFDSDTIDLCIPTTIPDMAVICENKPFLFLSDNPTVAHLDRELSDHPEYELDIHSYRQRELPTSALDKVTKKMHYAAHARSFIETKEKE